MWLLALIFNVLTLVGCTRFILSCRLFSEPLPWFHMQEVLPFVWKAQGAQSGPILTILGGVHGNEKTGVEVVLSLRDKITQGQINILAGTLYLGLGNPRAIEINERGSAPFMDLNRAFHLDLLMREPDGTYEDERARELAPILSTSDFLVDLHATNKPSEPFLACLHTQAQSELYQWYPCKKILLDNNHVVGGTPITTEEYIEAHGGVGIAFETGQADDVSRIAQVEEQTMNLLKHFGYIEGEPITPEQIDHEVYDLLESILLTDDGWEYAEGFGESSWQPFVAGQVVGYHGDQPLVPYYDGVIVFPKLPEHRTLGKPVGYLAKRIQ